MALRRPPASAAWILGVAALFGCARLAEQGAGPRGLQLTVLSAPDPAATARRVSEIDLRDLRGDARLPRGALQARWEGFWRVEEGGPHKLVARSEGAAALSLDGREVFSGRPGAR
ncbi:MAG TPA: hypothetical protein VF310_03900, partial [Vicinamibacteria bacterium]